MITIFFTLLCLRRHIWESLMLRNFYAIRMVIIYNLEVSFILSYYSWCLTWWCSDSFYLAESIVFHCNWPPSTHHPGECNFEKMTAYEPDQEVIRWGLNFLDCPYFNSHYGVDNTHQDGNIYNEQYDNGQYMREYHYDTQPNYVESDEIFAQALQEQMSQLAVSEVAEPPQEEGMHVHPYHIESYWLPPPTNYYSEYTTRYSGEDEADDSRPSSSCSSPGEILCDGEDYRYSLELIDEYDLDGELGKRLTQMVPVPHVPRINGEIPSIDEATSDHQRLLDRLQLYDLVERKIQGDGNCQFRALSDQFYRSHEHHKFVRRQVVSQLRSHPEFYEGYVPMEYGEYLKKMSKSGEWGDHVTLQAAADSYGVKIFVITSFKDTCYIEILPKDQKSKRVIFLSFWAEVHYNSIYPQGEQYL